MKVIVVDDDPFVREVAGIFLQGAGLEPVEAADGDEAIAAFEKGPFAIALIDLLMPNREGLETIAEIKRRWPATRVITMSDGSKLIDKAQALDWAQGFGADAIIGKPFDPRSLIEQVDAQRRAAPVATT